MRDQLTLGDVAARKAYLSSVVIVSEDKIRNVGSNDNIRFTFGPEAKAVQEMVPLAGIEPALLAELDFESSASTSSATGAPGTTTER